MVHPLTPRLHSLTREDPTSADALIIILFGEGQMAEAEDLVQQWGPAVPRGAFAGLELDLTMRRMDAVRLRDLLTGAAESHGLHSQQIVLLGAGRAGQVAIDLALLGVVPGAAVITLNIPLEATAATLAPAPAAVRMVQHSSADDPNGERFHAVVDALQRRQVNIRSMLLPDLEAATERATRRAAGAFLVELVANASRMAPSARTWP